MAANSIELDLSNYQMDKLKQYVEKRYSVHVTDVNQLLLFILQDMLDDMAQFIQYGLGDGDYPLMDLLTDDQKAKCLVDRTQVS